MTCDCNKPQGKFKNVCGANTPPVLEVHSEECPVLFHTVVIPASAGDPTTMPPEPGMYRNVRLTYEATGDSYLFDSDGIPQYLANKGIVDSVNGKIGVVVLNAADVNAQAPLTAGANIAIDSDNVISATDTTYTAGTNVSIDSDNVISATNTTYTAGANVTIDSDNVISATDTTYTAGANITIDANNEISATNTTYTAGTNVSIDPDNVISATDTTYSNFVGTDGVDSGSNGLVPAPSAADASKFLKADGTWAATPDTTYTNFTGTDGVDPGTAGLVPAPTASDTDKYLKSDGTWATVSGGSSVTLYTDIGQNTDGALTQKCATDLLFNGNSKNKVQIGSSASATSSDSIAIGTSATANSQYAVSIGQGTKAGSGGICIGRKSSSDNLGSQSVAIGINALAKGAYAICLGQSNASASSGIAIGKDAKAGVNATNSDSIAIGEYSKNEYSHSIALGAFSQTRAQGVIDISTGNTTYNLKSGYQGVNDAQRTQYKVISGVHDGEDDHDAMTVGQVKTLAYKLVTVDPSQNNTPADFIGQMAIWYEEPITGITQLRGRFLCTVIDTTQSQPYYGWQSF